VIGWLLAGGYADAGFQMAKQHGYTFSTTDSAAKPPVPASVAAKLATLTDAELAALGLTRTPVAAA
jgi:hypothetical protein